MPVQLGVEGVGDERAGGRGQGEVADEDRGEQLGGERGGEVPFDLVDEVEGADLDVELVVQGGKRTAVSIGGGRASGKLVVQLNW